MIRSLPVHSVVEIEEVNATISALMRKCLLNEQPRKWSSGKKPVATHAPPPAPPKILRSLGSLTRDPGSDASLESHDALLSNPNSSDPSLSTLIHPSAAVDSTLLPLLADEAWIQATATSLMQTVISTNSHTQVREAAIAVLQLLHEVQSRAHPSDLASGSAGSAPSFSSFLHPLFASLNGTSILQRKLLPVRNLDYMISSAEVLVFYFKHYPGPPPSQQSAENASQQQGIDGSKGGGSAHSELSQMIVIAGEAIALCEKEDASLASRMVSYGGGGPTPSAILKLRCKVSTFK